MPKLLSYSRLHHETVYDLIRISMRQHRKGLSRHIPAHLFTKEAQWRCAARLSREARRGMGEILIPQLAAGLKRWFTWHKRRR